MLKSVPSAIFCCGSDFSILEVNTQFCDLVGKSRENCLGNSLDSILPEEMAEKVTSSLSTLANGGACSEFELSLKNEEGDDAHFAINLQQIDGTETRVERFVGSLQDISHLRKKEGSLIAEHELLRTVIDILPAFIYAKDTDSKFIIANEVLAGSMGCGSCDDLIGKTDFEFFPHKYAIKYYCDEQEVITSGRPKINIQESFGFDENMEPMWLNTTKVPLINSSGEIVGIVGSGMDISKQKRNNDKLKELQEIVDNSHSCAFLLSSHDNWIVNFCSNTVSIFGYEVEDFSNRKIKFLELVHPDDVENVSNETIDSFNRRLVNFTLEYRIRRKDGGYCWVEDHKHLREVCEDGSYLFQSLITDITARYEVKQERDEMEIQLRQAQKLEAVGQLAAGIAHEINTPIQFISDNLEFLMDSAKDYVSFHKGVVDQLDKSDPIQGEIFSKLEKLAEELDLEFLSEEVPMAISQSLEGAHRVRDIVQAMKEFSHPGSGDISQEDINKAIRNTITVARNEWKYVADVETELDESIESVPVYIGPIKQTILNLIVNAAHAIEDRVKAGEIEKGKITIRSRIVEDSVEIEVEDTGKGMSQEVAERVFDPFFTTKEVGKGTGQGLSMAYDIVVRKHKGKLRFNSEEGIGTTFIIALPLTVE